MPDPIPWSEASAENIRRWQNAGVVHPLTCGNDSRHRVLEPAKDGKHLVLRCPDCDYRQEWVPVVVYDHDPEVMQRMIELGKGRVAP